MIERLKTLQGCVNLARARYAIASLMEKPLCPLYRFYLNILSIDCRVCFLKGVLTKIKTFLRKKM